MMFGTGRSARDHAAEIVAALEDGDNEGAADLAAQGLALFPEAAVFHRLHGIALFALGANDEAKGHLTAALAVDPLDNAALLALARLADAEGDPYTAAEHFLTAWEHDPANPDLRAELTTRLATLYGAEGYLQFTRPALAALYVRNVYPERAAREYAAILADHPNRTDLRLAAALAQWRLGNLMETVTECGALLDEQPGVVRARWALADATARLGRGETAREHAREAARFDPDGAIARELIAGNRDAAIVDPDEPLRVPGTGRGHLRPVPAMRDVTTAGQDAASTIEPDRQEAAEPAPLHAAPEDSPPKSDTMRLVETLSGLAAAIAAAKREDRQAGGAPDHAERAAYVVDPRAVPEWAQPREPPEPEMILPHAEGLAEAITALDAPLETLPNPLDVPYAESEDRATLETTLPDAVDEPEPVVAVVEEDGSIVATRPGGEPMLDAADVLPTPPAPFPTGEGEAVGAHRDAPPADAALSGDPVAAVRARVRAGDVVGAVGTMRAALAAAGTDQDQLRALLPALRALVDATPQRPDSRRLLGDAYARLGLYAQAQGQYRQALLVRVAGKGAGR